MCQLAWDLNSDRYDRSQTTDLNNSTTRYHPATALTAFVHYNSACRPLLSQSGLRGGRGDINLFPLIPACTGRPGLPLTAPDIDFLASPSRRL